MALTDEFLRAIVVKGAEELYLVAGKQPVMRTGGAATPLIPGAKSAEEIEAMLAEVVPPRKLKDPDFNFQYTAAFGAFSGVAHHGDSAVQVLMKKGSGLILALPGGAPAAAPAPAAPAAPPPPPAAAPVEEEIEISAVEEAPVAPPPPRAPTPPVAPAAPQPAAPAAPAPRPAAPAPTAAAA